MSFSVAPLSSEPPAFSNGGNSYCRRSNLIGPDGNWRPNENDSTRLDACNAPRVGGSGNYELDYFQYNHPNPVGALYTQHGLVRTSNPRELVPKLPVYQQRTFLTSEYYNSGCASLFCSGNTEVYPTGQPGCRGPVQSSWSDAKLNPFFQSTDPFIGNAVPTGAVCYKGISPNSTAGWIFVTPASGGAQVPMWTVSK